MAGSTILNVDPDECRRRGGIPFVHKEGTAARYDPFAISTPTFVASTAPIYGCYLPDAPAAGSGDQVNVTVPTQVQAQVSPQVSPILTQQDQPTNSPVETDSTQAVERMLQEFLQAHDQPVAAGGGGGGVQPVAYDTPVAETAAVAAPGANIPWVWIIAAAIAGMIFFNRRKT